MQHTALLLVSFGTSRPDAFRREIEPTLDALRTAAGDLDEPGFLAWLKAHVE